MRNAKWDNAEHTSIVLEIEHPRHGWIPFGATNGDQTTQGVFNAAVAAGGIAEYVAPVKSAGQLRAEAKAARATAVAAITVTTSAGKVFDGDETSQTRMARAIIGMQAASVGTISWTLANNQSVTVTIAELTEALILAGQEQAALWPIS
jgi:hypothetical protein